jgi:hypothetical protein
MLANDKSMDLLTVWLKILRRDPMVTRDDVLFLAVFGGTMLLIVSIAIVTLVFGDGATFVNWLFGRPFFKDS